MHDLLIWLTLSVGLYALACNLAWAWHRQAAGWQAALLRPPVPQVARVAYLLGLPALALQRKVPGIAVGMGLATEPGGDLSLTGRLHPAESLLIVLGLAAGGAAIWGFGRVWHGRARGEVLEAGSRRLSVRQLLGLAEAALLQESHWAFYRAGVLASGLVSLDLAVFLSLLVLALEAWSSPALRLGAHRVETAEHLGQNLALAALSATAYLCTGAFLWSLLSQWLMMLLLSATGTYLEPPTAEASDRPATAALRPSTAPRSQAPQPIEPTVV